MRRRMEKYSKDRVVNKKRRELLQLCEDRGWAVFNGNKEEDEDGEFTYVGERGASVMDYVLTNAD